MGRKMEAVASPRCAAAAPLCPVRQESLTAVVHRRPTATESDGENRRRGPTSMLTTGAVPGLDAARDRHHDCARPGISQGVPSSLFHITILQWPSGRGAGRENEQSYRTRCAILDPLSSHAPHSTRLLLDMSWRTWVILVSVNLFAHSQRTAPSGRFGRAPEDPFEASSLHKDIVTRVYIDTMADCSRTGLWPSFGSVARLITDSSIATRRQTACVCDTANGGIGSGRSANWSREAGEEIWFWSLKQSAAGNRNKRVTMKRKTYYESTNDRHNQSPERRRHRPRSSRRGSLVLLYHGSPYYA
ncbi:hypothetical protein P154DRAFT_533405 [Amniculicola lignicola CBS 123094]|uniref:Uncharacterized protein n=1 Tax=Amniculicola lignicola CBS 123094 TaxID=1392246 RepID=A0A6A5WN25_9PLEO|nr:hypothetical protein P154DRAFT_533405 [Amniculicola lignicola CBS 123094]